MHRKAVQPRAVKGGLGSEAAGGAVLAWTGAGLCHVSKKIGTWEFFPFQVQRL